MSEVLERVGNPFSNGDKVRLKPEFADGDEGVATVVNTLDGDNIEGGLLLDRMLNGFRYWNAQDVDRVSEALRPNKD